LVEKNRTIIMLSAKRCGSTAMFKIFQKHPNVGVCHVNQKIDFWEPNFWNLGADAIQGSPENFISRFEKSHSFLKFPKKFTEKSLFQLWDDILFQLGPILFDKSPQYLGNKYALELIKKYKDSGNDVRLFGMIRDPRDAITSQYELWRRYVNGDSPKRREIQWLKMYSHFEFYKKNVENIPLYKYEDFSLRINHFAPKLMEYCGLSDIPYSYDHFRPTSIGRYLGSINPRIRAWRFSKNFEKHLDKYGYGNLKISVTKKFFIMKKMFKANFLREVYALKRIIN